MGLIHWWPLNGDLYDRGSNPHHGTIVGAANVTTSGVLGQCLSGMSGSQTTAGVSVANCNLVNELSGKDYSFACWFKVHGTHVHYNGTLMSSGNWNSDAWAVGVDQTNSKIDVFNDKYNKWVNIGYTLTNNKWYHLVSVQQEGTNYIYLNGSLIGSVSSTALYRSNATNLCIGRETYASGHFSFNGDICDVRVYDHALSVKEIQELSKGLMLHYTFNDIGSENTTNLITGIKSAHGKSSLYGNGVKINWSPSGGDSYFMFNYSQAIKANGIYTLSFDCEGLKPGEVATFAVSNLSAAPYNIALKNGRNSLTFTAGSDLMSDINTHNRLFFDDKTRTNGAVFYLSNFQLEEKDHATAYVNGSRNNPYYDESGYNNDGIQNQIDYTSNSNNGSCCASFNGTHSYIELPNWKPSLPNEPYTIAFWVKSGEDKTRDIYFGNHANSSETFNIERTDSNYLRIYYASDTPIGAISAITIPVNTWVHIVMTFDGTTFRAYKDGVEKYNKALTKTLNCTNTKWKIGSDYRTAVGTSEATRYKGLMSDFRIYASALTSAQVLELYESKAEIDKNQNVFTNEIIEQQNTGNMVNATSWEQSGIYDDGGTNTNDMMMTRIRSKYIPVLPGVTYYYGVRNSSMKVRGVHYYNASNVWIGYISEGGSQTTPSNCAYVRWVIQNTNASTEVPVANIATYGPYMVYQGQPTPQGLDEGTEVQVNKNYTITTKDICEGHDSGFFIDGTATGNQFYEI